MSDTILIILFLCGVMIFASGVFYIIHYFREKKNDYIYRDNYTIEDFYVPKRKPSE
jgi:uncharacterized membrane protein HdeD (DUF308 family)